MTKVTVIGATIVNELGHTICSVRSGRVLPASAPQIEALKELAEAFNERAALLAVVEAAREANRTVKAIAFTGDVTNEIAAHLAAVGTPLGRALVALDKCRKAPAQQEGETQ